MIKGGLLGRKYHWKNGVFQKRSCCTRPLATVSIRGQFPPKYLCSQILSCPEKFLLSI